jgi:hypothetical protein
MREAGNSGEATCVACLPSLLKKECTYSSLIQLPTLTPAPQLKPPLFIKLLAKSPFIMLSLRIRELDIGIPPAYCEMLPLRAPYDSFIIIGMSLAAWS